MDPRYTGEIFKHLEKQNELLMEACNAMSRELHNLQVEEEMLMRRCYAVTTARNVIKQTDHANALHIPQSNSSRLLLTHHNSDFDSAGGEAGHATTLEPAKTSEEEQGE